MLSNNIQRLFTVLTVSLIVSTSVFAGELSIDALNFSTDILKKRGCFVTKIFMGPSFNEIVAKAKKNFENVNVFKPPASRKDSKENFIICKFLR